MKYKDAVEFLEDLGRATLHGALPVKTQYKLFQVATFMWGRADKLEIEVQDLKKVLEARGGVTLPTEYKLAQQIRWLEEEVARLKGEAGIKTRERGPFITIPFMCSREFLVKVLDELMFRMKGSDLEDQMFSDFYTQLRSFIKRWNLDQDQHSFASLPEEG